MRFHGRSRGLTMIELTVAMASVVVIVLGSTIEVFTTASLAAKERTQVALSRDACAALRTMQTALRGANHAAISISGNTLTLLDTGDSFSLTAKNLVYHHGGVNTIVVKGNVTGLTFNLAPGAAPNTFIVTVALTLASSSAALSTQSTIALRNDLEVGL